MKETTARPESAGAPPPADAAVPPATDPTIADRRAARLSRVGDYQTRTLAQEDALLANLGSISGWFTQRNAATEVAQYDCTLC